MAAAIGLEVYGPPCPPATAFLIVSLDRPVWTGASRVPKALLTADRVFGAAPDFPPLWGVLDAHALWHLATAVICPLWCAAPNSIDHSSQ